MPQDVVDLIDSKPRLETYRCRDCGCIQQQPADLPSAGAPCVECNASIRPTWRIRPAPIGPRVLAAVVDVGFLVIPYFTLSLIFFIISPTFPRDADDDLTPRTVLTLRIVTVAVMFVWLWLQEARGQTFGKLLTSLHVVQTDTWARPGLIAGFIRVIAKALSIAPFGIGYLGVFSDAHRRAFHDWVAGTRVVER